MTDVPDIEGLMGDGMLGNSHQAPLDADHVPNENQSHTCFSCHEPLGALFCGNCGQKNDDFRRPLWQLGREAIASLTALENKIWRTWATLFVKPGRVPREFADGRRTHWSSPVRIYIFMSIVLFFFMEITGTLFFALEGSLQPKDGIDRPVAELSADEVGWSISPHWFPTKTKVESWNEDFDFDLFSDALFKSEESLRKTFAQGLREGLRGGDIDVDDVLETLDANTGPITTGEKAALDAVIANLTTTADTLSGTPGEAALRATIADIQTDIDSRKVSESPTTPEPEFNVSFKSGEGISGERFLREMIQNPAVLNNVLNRWLPRIIFVMMPLTMLIGAMFIRGLPRSARRKSCPRGERHALLYDHLVHATYIHAVAYAVLFIGIIAARLLPDAGGLIALSLLIFMLVYLPISLRRMFRRGWFKTLWTAYGVAFIHMLIVTSLIICVIADALQDYFAT